MAAETPRGCSRLRHKAIALLVITVHRNLIEFKPIVYVLRIVILTPSRWSASAYAVRVMQESFEYQRPISMVPFRSVGWRTFIEDPLRSRFFMEEFREVEHHESVEVIDASFTHLERSWSWRVATGTGETTLRGGLKNSSNIGWEQDIPIIFGWWYIRIGLGTSPELSVHGVIS
ncbi:hypothetical protein Tco_0613282 [Tanacetum coccineum]